LTPIYIASQDKVEPIVVHKDEFLTRKYLMNALPESDPINTDRRDLLQSAGGVIITGLAAAGATLADPAMAQPVRRMSAAERNSAPLGRRLQGVQHFGVTVQNMDRAFEFYTEVLGGTEVMRDGDFQGEKIHDTLLLDQDLIALEKKIDPRTMGVADLKSGSQRLDVRFVQFDNVVIELLQYRDASQPMGNGASWAEPRGHMSPAYPRSMHICFYIRDDVDFNKFIHDLETESAQRGMGQVRANRIVTVKTEQERLAAPIDTNTNEITSGKSNGWALIYCKGPEGEQLEFVQALSPVKEVFANALAERNRVLAGSGG